MDLYFVHTRHTILSKTDQIIMAVGVQNVIVDFMTITTSQCGRFNEFGKRDSNVTAPASCSFGSCGKSCLTQGSFCCNPGG